LLNPNDADKSSDGLFSFELRLRLPVFDTIFPTVRLSWLRTCRDELLLISAESLGGTMRCRGVLEPRLLPEELGLSTRDEDVGTC
jgi:hypothetical protein